MLFQVALLVIVKLVTPRVRVRVGERVRVSFIFNLDQISSLVFPFTDCFRSIIR